MVELYLWENCPFCRKVLHAAENMGLQKDVDYKIVDSAPGTAGRAVVEKTGGKSMVPFLIDKEVAMYESDDIILYLQNNIKK